MGRPSTVESHPKLDAILAEIRAGRTLTEIAARYGLSLQAMSRFVISRKSQLVAELDDDGITVSSLVQRLTDVADAAREARKQSQFASQATRSRALEAEARVITQIMNQVGIDDITVSDNLRDGQRFVRLVAKWATEHPEHAFGLVSALQADNDLNDLGDALAARLENQKQGRNKK